MLAIVLATVLASGTPAPAARPSFDLPKTSSPPRIDGSLSDPGWAGAATLALGYNLRVHQAADQQTTVRVVTDGTALYVAFDARQTQPVQATQHSNDVSLSSDDNVTAYLWPAGTGGFAYAFSANAIGTHTQFSTENTAYAPTWQSAGKIVPGGYAVTMRIPFSVLRGSSGRWNVQFERFIPSTQDDYEWAYAPQQQTGDVLDVLYSGVMSGIPAQTTATRPRPRIGIYGLGELASAAAGGSTSRMGADLAIPVSSGASFIAALHPDYSNVELDQQTITPTAFARQYQEVRPFFTQGANFYGEGYCTACTAQELYTPAIPTPRDGYALEGKQGEFSFAGFDAVGIGRSDAAQALNFATPDQRISASLNRISVDLPGFHDDTATANLSYNNQRGMWEYVDVGKETGTTVLDPAQGWRREAGLGLYDRTGGIFASVRRIGEFYSPADGYVQHTDIAGYNVNADRTWYYKKSAFIPRLIVAAYVDRYHGSDGRLNQTDTGFAAGADVRPSMHVRVGIGSSYLRLADGTFTPISQNGVDLYFHYRTTTPSQISFYQGRFGPGRLDSWIRSTTFKAGPRGFVSLEADDNVQQLDRGERFVSWLDRLTYTFEDGRDSTFGIGIRRELGAFPIVSAAFPNPPVAAWNLSAAYYRRVPHGELYLVYGDANAFSTAPQFIVKFIHYVGADKGT